MSGNYKVTKVDDSFGINYLVVCHDVGQLTFDARF